MKIYVCSPWLLTNQGKINRVSDILSFELQALAADGTLTALGYDNTTGIGKILDGLTFNPAPTRSINISAANAISQFAPDAIFILGNQVYEIGFGCISFLAQIQAAVDAATGQNVSVATLRSVFTNIRNNLDADIVTFSAIVSLKDAAKAANIKIRDQQNIN